MQFVFSTCKMTVYIKLTARNKLKLFQKYVGRYKRYFLFDKKKFEVRLGIYF